MYTFIGTAGLNDVDPQAWARRRPRPHRGTPQNRLDELHPWNWSAARQRDLAA